MNKNFLAIAFLVLLASSVLAQTYNYYNQPTVIPGQQPSRISQADIERALRSIAQAYGQVQGRFIAQQQIGYPLPTVTPGQPSVLGSLQNYFAQNYSIQAPASGSGGAQANPFLAYGYNQEVTDIFSRDFVRQEQGQAPLYSLPQHGQDPRAQGANYARPPQAAASADYSEVKLVELRDRSVSAGEVEIFDVAVINTSFVPKNYSLHVEKEDASIKASLSESAFTLTPGESRGVKVLIEPSKATKGGSKIAYLVVTSSGLSGPQGPEYDSIAEGQPQAPPAPVSAPQRLIVSLEDFQKPIKPESVVLKINRLEYDVGAKGFDIQVTPNQAGGSDKIDVAITEDFFIGNEATPVQVFFMDTFNNAYELSFELVPSKYEVKARNLEFKAQIYKAMTYGRELRNAYFRARAGTGKYVKNNAYQLRGAQAFVKIEDFIPVGSKNAFEFYAEDQFGTYFKALGSFTIQFLAPEGFVLPNEGTRAYGDNLEYREALTFAVLEKESLRDVLQITGYPSEITLRGGERKAFEVTLQNMGLEAAKDIDLQLNGLPQGVSFTSGKAEEIAPGKSAVVKAELSTNLDTQQSANLELVASAIGFVSSKQITLKLEPKARAAEENLVKEVVEKELGKTSEKSGLSDEAIKAEVEKMITALQTDGLKAESAQKIRELIPADFAVKTDIVNANGKTIETLYGIKKGADLFVTKTYDGVVNSNVKLDYDTLSRLAKENMAGAFGQAGLVGFGLGDQRVAVGIVILIIGAIAIVLLLKEKPSHPDDKFLHRKSSSLHVLKHKVH